MLIKRTSPDVTGSANIKIIPTDLEGSPALDTEVVSIKDQICSIHSIEVIIPNDVEVVEELKDDLEPVKSNHSCSNESVEPSLNQVESSSKLSQFELSSESDQVEASSKLKQFELSSYSNQIEASSILNQIESSSKSNQIEASSKSNQIEASSKSNQIKTSSKSNQIEASSKSNQIENQSKIEPFVKYANTPVKSTHLSKIFARTLSFTTSDQILTWAQHAQKINLLSPRDLDLFLKQMRSDFSKYAAISQRVRCDFKVDRHSLTLDKIPANMNGKDQVGSSNALGYQDDIGIQSMDLPSNHATVSTKRPIDSISSTWSDTELPNVKQSKILSTTNIDSIEGEEERFSELKPIDDDPTKMDTLNLLFPPFKTEFKLLPSKFGLHYSDWLEDDLYYPWATFNPQELFHIDARLNNKVSLWKGDLTKLKVDAIVNAANESLLGGGGIDYAIHSAAGHNLHKACYKLGGTKPGTTKVTLAFQLPSEYIFHTVGPRYNSSLDPIPATRLCNCYASCLNLALEKNIRTLAFCCVSTGIYKFPHLAATHIALGQVRTWLQEKNHAERIDRIVFCIWTSATHDWNIYEKMLQVYFPVTEINNPPPERIDSKKKNQSKYSETNQFQEIVTDENANVVPKKSDVTLSKEIA